MSFFPSSKVNSRKKYQPNLVSLMSLCANNYFLFLKIQADQTQLYQQRHFFINDHLAYAITVNEVTRYTSLIKFEQKVLVQKDVEQQKSANKTLLHSLHPRMSIRLYHDARMAEVISSQDIHQVKPRYDYPNKHMHQQDEKQQINQFLNEWLHLCLTHGQVDVELKANL
ncbi:MAG: DUF1249 domain-containing protein [Colwellia sp.]|nr:DUF1249 domain-containing protein [Colwellia sp.]